MSEAALASGEIIQSDTAREELSRDAMPVAVPKHTKPHTLEHHKTPDERAEDIAYTINHAVSCATTDVFIVPTIAAGFKPNKVGYFSEAFGYMRGEIIGDFAAVPLTIFVQRHFPSFMETVRRISEPLASPLFHHGARSAAERWGKKHGYEKTDQEVVDRAEEIYQHEVKHLPQALVWNLISFPLGVVGQMATGHEHGDGHSHGGGDWKTIARNKLLGTAISNVLLIGGRALIPDKAEKFDRLDGKYVIRPVTRAVSGLFGIDSKTMDRMDEKAAADEHRANGSWRARVRHEAHEYGNTQPSI